MRHVIKLGGSLLDLPDLRQRLTAFIQTCHGDDLLLLVGGGRVADLVRQWDGHHHVGPQAGHWLAVRAMQFNAHLVLTLLEGACLVSDQADCQTAWAEGRVSVAEPIAWLRSLETTDRPVPHRWSFTSDSIAAHLAVCLEADCLTLLKSTLPSQDCGLTCAAGLGLVDEDFPAAAAELPQVRLVNLRDQTMPCCELSD